MPKVNLLKNRRSKKPFKKSDNTSINVTLAESPRFHKSKFTPSKQNPREPKKEKITEAKKVSFKTKINLDKRNKIIEKRKNKEAKKFSLFKKKQIPEKVLNPTKNNPVKKQKKESIFKNFYKRKSFILFIIFLFILIILIVVIKTKLFDIHKIIVHGNQNTSTNDLIEYTEKNGGNGLIFNISPARLEKNIEDNFGFVQSATVEKDIPGTLKIDIVEFKPNSIVQTKNNAYLVSTTGVVLFTNVDSQKLKSQYPIVNLDEDTDLKPKDFVDEKIIDNSLKVLDLAKSVDDVNTLLVKRYPDGSADATITLSDGKIWLLTLTNRNIDDQFNVFKQVKGMKDYKTLDTRFAGSYIIK